MFFSRRPLLILLERFITPRDLTPRVDGAQRHGFNALFESSCATLLLTCKALYLVPAPPYHEENSFRIQSIASADVGKVADTDSSGY